MDTLSTTPTITWIVRALFAGSALAYAGHLWLVWRGIRQARAAALGWSPVYRHRVQVEARVLVHEGEGFLLRDVLPAPNEP